MALNRPRVIQYVDQESDRSTSWPEGTICYAASERSIQVLKSGSWQDFSNTGGTGGGNSATVTVDFGSSFTNYAETVVTSQTWVEAGSEFCVTPVTSGTDEIEIAIMQFSPVVFDVVAGTGFTLGVFAPIEAKGTYTFSVIGV